MFLPSNMIFWFNFSSNNSKSRYLNSFHSVIRIRASDPSKASYLFSANSIELKYSSSIALLNSAVAWGSYALILAPLLISSEITTIDVASRTSSVPGLNERPQMLK